MLVYEVIGDNNGSEFSHKLFRTEKSANEERDYQEKMNSHIAWTVHERYVSE